MAISRMTIHLLYGFVTQDLVFKLVDQIAGCVSYKFPWGWSWFTEFYNQRHFVDWKLISYAGDKCQLVCFSIYQKNLNIILILTMN